MGQTIRYSSICKLVRRRLLHFSPSFSMIMCCPSFYPSSIFISIQAVFKSSLCLHVLPSVQFSCSVMSDSLWPHGLQHARLPCPSPTHRACSNSSPLSQWCHPTISSSVIPFFSRLQSFPASGSFQMSQFLISGGQSIGVSASVLPMNIQDWFPLGLIALISLQSKGLSRVFSNTTVQKHQFFSVLSTIQYCFPNWYSFH